MPVIIKCSKNFHDYIFPYLDWTTEEFWVTSLSSDHRVIRSKCLFKGTVDACPVFPRDILRFVCLHNAARFIVSHSHPSGCPRPSKEDDIVTKQILFLSELVEIPLIDHIIISEHSFYSYADEKWNGIKIHSKL